MLKNKLLYLTIFLQLFQVSEMVCQESQTIIETDFAIRDFYPTHDSIFYIKKRDVHLYSLKTKASKNYFIGGYGLEMYTSKNSNSIITASNELVRNVSSIRFYNKSTNKFDAVFYYKEGKVLDFLLIPEANLFALSLTNKKIIFIDYRDKPKFYKTIEINLNALSRKLIYKKNKLYFATDIGEVYEYDFYSYKKKLIYNASELITDFIIDEHSLVYTTIKGKIVKVNLKSKEKNEQKVKNTFISTFIQFDNNTLVCGSWNGKIYVLDKNDLSIKKELNYHRRAVLKIKKDKNNIIYSSSLDKTIKKWNLN